VFNRQNVPALRTTSFDHSVWFAHAVCKIEKGIPGDFTPDAKQMPPIFLVAPGAEQVQEYATGIGFGELGL